MGFQGFILSDWAAMVSGVNSALAGTGWSRSPISPDFDNSYDGV